MFDKWEESSQEAAPDDGAADFGQSYWSKCIRVSSTLFAENQKKKKKKKNEGTSERKKKRMNEKKRERACEE